MALWLIKSPVNPPKSAYQKEVEGSCVVQTFCVAISRKEEDVISESLFFALERFFVFHHQPIKIRRNVLQCNRHKLLREYQISNIKNIFSFNLNYIHAFYPPVFAFIVTFPRYLDAIMFFFAPLTCYKRISEDWKASCTSQAKWQHWTKHWTLLRERGDWVFCNVF